MTTDTIENRWSACPPGSLGSIVRRSRSRQRNALFREAAAMLVMAASIGFAAGYFARNDAPQQAPSAQFNFAGLTCHEVHQLLPALMNHRLEPAKASRVRQHVMLCPECNRLMERMQTAPSVGQSIGASPHATLAASTAVRRVGDRQL